MVNGYPKESVMNDPISDVVFAIYEAIASDYMNMNEEDMTTEDFENILRDYGFMIVPIEDPTNLFSIQEDSL